MIWAQEFPACHSNLWQRIDGWEVVIAVLFIMTCWAAVNVGRQYFMFKIAAIKMCKHCGEDPNAEA